MSKEKFKEYYQDDNVTGTYDSQRLGTEYRIKKREKELNLFLELIDKHPEDKVLEIGCSSGFLTEHLGAVTAVDTSKEMLKITKKKNPSATVLEADMFKLPFGDNSFDKIITMRVWDHLNEDDLRLALKESKRVLKSGGILVFDAEEKNWLRKFVHFFYKRIFRITGYKIYPYSIKRMKEILSEEDFGWEICKFINHRIGRQIILRVTNI